MKILYLHQYFKKPSMNGGVRSYEFAKRLVRDGHRVIIITADTENDFKSWNIENIDGIEVHWLSIKYDNSFGFHRRLLAFFKFLILSTLHIIPIKADKIIATSTPLTISIPAIFYKLIRKKEFIFEVRDVWPEVPIALGFLNNRFLRSLATFLEKVTYHQASSLIALSPDMKKSISNRVTDKKIEVIPNASDTHLFEKELSYKETDRDIFDKLVLIKRNHDKVAFYTGTIGMVNNLSYIINLASFSSGEIAFVIIGSGKEKKELEALADENGTLGKTVYFFDSIPKDKLYIVHHLYDIAFSTVLPIKELYANSANKIFDAFASGCPICINHSGWLKELIDKKNCGLVLQDNATKSEFDKLRIFLNSEQKMKEARRASKRLGQIDFNRERLYVKFKEVLENEKDI